MNSIIYFTEEMVSLAKSYCDDADEAATPEGGGSFGEYTIISFHGLRISSTKLVDTATQALRALYNDPRGK